MEFVGFHLFLATQVSVKLKYQSYACFNFFKKRLIIILYTKKDPNFEVKYRHYSTNLADDPLVSWQVYLR